MLCFIGTGSKLRNFNDDDFSAVIADHTLERVHSAECLGVIIDELNWHKHVNSVIQKVSCKLALFLGPVAKFRGRRDWARPGLARPSETTRRRRIADVWILYARKAVRDVCYHLLKINYFYSHQ